MKHIKAVSVAKAGGIADGVQGIFDGIADFVAELLKKDDED